jgi:hypothetical protein
MDVLWVAPPDAVATTWNVVLPEGVVVVVIGGVVVVVEELEPPAQPPSTLAIQNSRIISEMPRRAVPEGRLRIQHPATSRPGIHSRAAVSVKPRRFHIGGDSIFDVATLVWSVSTTLADPWPKAEGRGT